MIKQAIETIVDKQDLSKAVAFDVMSSIMSGEVNDVQLGGFLTALRVKGETVEEITGFAEAMRAKALRLTHDDEVFEIVGTGGDKANTFNISTTAGLVIAAGGVKVAKHGNRSVSSKCGAADCLEALGVKLEVQPDANEDVLNQVGMCFMFAPVYHRSMKYAGPVRKALGIRTVFNVLGPLTNPAGATKQLMGVYDEALVEPLAKVLVNLGVERGAVVYGMDGLDEITACAPTKVCEIDHGTLKTYLLDPKDYNFDYAQRAELVGGDAAVNADITRSVLSGEKGPRRQAVVLNAGMGFHLTLPNVSIEDGIRMAERLIDDGSAMNVLNRFIAATNQ
ncbi:MAG: anthranilate phosphoribosyltransferase [Veillonella sp.]|uniref:anthranilate phosphoribosyltransferase n=1 Tax=Veillonella sp. TaxID=1926307 RepID=UPI0025DFD029|nr:anthranilate phosphoribosyltransferase [Veillonella sp.]MBS4913065.1 anthranilate phosphoribosyltransferase [Veillonella sp.]